MDERMKVKVYKSNRKKQVNNSNDDDRIIPKPNIVSEN